jgi:tetratricopeptide (TPR) repeat protein
MRTKRFFLIAPTTVLLTIWQPLRLNFPVTSLVLPAAAQTLDAFSGQLASLIQLAQTSQDREIQGERLFQTGVEQFYKGQLREALATFQQVRTLSREQGDKLGEAKALSGIGEVYIYGLHPRSEALNVLQEALAIYQKLGSSPQTQLRHKQGEARAIALTGLAYSELNQKDEALKNLQQALTIQREIGDKEGEGKTLNHLADVYIGGNTDQKRLKEALELLQQALTINREVNNQSNETVSLGMLGWVYNNLGNNEQALKFLNEALAKSRENGFRLWQGQVLVMMTIIYNTQGNTQQALASAQQALPILKSVGSDWTNTALFLLGGIYQNQKQYPQAREYYEQALAIAKQTDNRTNQAQSLLNIGNTYGLQGYELLRAGSEQHALEAFQQQLKFSQSALTIAQNLPDSQLKNDALLGIAYAYSAIGFAYDAQKQYSEAIAASGQAIDFARQAGEQELECQFLTALEYRHADLGNELVAAGEFQQALTVFQQGLKYGEQALAIAQNDKQKKEALTGIRIIHGDIGFLYDAQEQYVKAIGAHQQSLAISRQIGDRSSEALTLNLIAGTHTKLGQFRQTLELYEQSLAIYRELREPLQEAATLLGIGRSYGELGQYSKARDYYQQALAITRQQGAALREASVLNNLGNIDEEQGEYAQALAHFQQALQISQELRRRLPTETANNMAQLCSMSFTASKVAYLANRELEDGRKGCLESAQSLEGKTLNNIGQVYTNQGRYPEALENHQQSLTIIRELKDRYTEATVLNNIGTVYLSQGEYTKALASIQQALEIKTAIGDRSGQRSSLNNIGQIYSEWGRYAQALEFYQKSLAIAQEIGERSGEATALGNIGSVYSEQGNYRQSMEYHQQALVIRKEIGDRSGEMTSLINIGALHEDQGRYAQALEFHQQALAIAKEIGERSAEATTLSNIGGVYDNQGNVSQSMEYYQQALAIRKAIGDRSGEANSLHNLGLSYYNQGEYAKALELLQQSLTITQEIGDRAQEAQYLTSIGGLYSTLGQYPQALEYRQQALSIAREIGNRPQEAIILNGIANTYERQKLYTEALEQYQQSLTIAREIGERAGEGYILTNIGYVYERKGEHSQALASLQQGLGIFRDIGEPSGESYALRGLGLVYTASKQEAEALKSYQQAITIQRKLGHRPDEGLTLSHLGNLYNSQGQYAEAQKSLFKAVEILESVRPSELTDEHKISLFDTQADTYRYLQQSLIAQNKTNAALEAAERGRARAFVELLAKQLSPQSKEPIKYPSLQEIKQIAQQQNATLVEYSIIPGQSLYIWVIQPTGKIDFRSVDLKTWLQEHNTSLADLVSNTRESIGVSRSIFSVEHPNPVDENNQTKRLQQLHQLLIKPIAGLLPTDSNQRIIFNPQGELFLVPFAALQDQQGKYLIENHTILIAPAIQVLQLTREQRQRVEAALPLQGNNALVVGNPTMPSVPSQNGDKPQKLANLPGAKREAEAIAPLLNTKALIGNEATKAAILAKLPRAKIIHLATHGLLDDLRGLGSAIALAPTNTDNGLLTAEEILQLKLNAQLIVLSACDTGRGRITGDGVIGLSRSLIAAGTPSVIVSLWAVPDNPTQELMTEFYRQLKLTGDKAQSLRQAMLQMKEKYPGAPRKWAAFTLIGEAE